MLQIGALAKQTGTTRETLRYYEEQGLIQSQRRANGYRSYVPEAVALVNYIRTAQQLGFTLAEIRESVQPLWVAADPASMLIEVLQQKIQQIDQRIADMQLLRDELTTRVRAECPLQRQKV
jgi:MerR family transcriptional regulator, copper efflux regulator